MRCLPLPVEGLTAGSSSAGPATLSALVGCSGAPHTDEELVTRLDLGFGDALGASPLFRFAFFVSARPRRAMCASRSELKICFSGLFRRDAEPDAAPFFLCVLSILNGRGASAIDSSSASDMTRHKLWSTDREAWCPSRDIGAALYAYGAGEDDRPVV